MMPLAHPGADHHQDRLSAVIAREAARFIAEEAGAESLITVIRAEPSAHGKRITVFVSVFPEEKGRSALVLLENRREAFSEHLKAHARLRPLPRVDFLLDDRTQLS